MLATWLRMKFPETFFGAIASSAPIIYFKDATSEYGFGEVTTRAFEQAEETCPARAQKSMEILQTYIDSDCTYAYEYLHKTFDTCDPIESKQEAQKLQELVTGAFFYLAMINYPYPTEFLQPVPAWPVGVSCSRLFHGKAEETEVFLSERRLEHSKSDHTLEHLYLESLKKAIDVYYNYNGDAGCLDLNGGSEGHLDAAGWWVMACNEMVMPMSFGTDKDMFLEEKFNYEEFSKSCEQRFGTVPQYDFAMDFFGGKNPKREFMYASNIVFVNGDLDPWSAGSITEEINEWTEVINIPEGAHHLDLRLPNKDDPQSVTDARNRIIEVLKQWERDFI